MRKQVINAGAIFTLLFCAGFSLVISQSNTRLNGIVINEIMQNSENVTDANGEWFELYNMGEEDVDIDVNGLVYDTYVAASRALLCAVRAAGMPSEPQSLSRALGEALRRLQ